MQEDVTLLHFIKFITMVWWTRRVAATIEYICSLKKVPFNRAYAHPHLGHWGKEMVVEKFDRLASLKGMDDVCIKTSGGVFAGTVVELSMTEVVMHNYRGDRLEEIAYIPIEEVRMIVHKPNG